MKTDLLYGARSFDPGALRVERDGEPVVVPCLSFTLWFDFTEAALLQDFYERVMEAVGGLFTHYIAESMKRPAKITPRALTMVPTWIKKPAENKLYYCQLRGAAHAHPASLEVLFYERPPLSPERQERYRRKLPALVAAGITVTTGLPATVFRVTLPLDHALAAPDKFASWATEFEAVKRGEILSGACDLAVNYDPSFDQSVEQQAWALCARHPGLDWFEPGTGFWLRRFERRIGDLVPLVKRAGWITFVSERSVDFLGGAEQLEAAVASDPAVASMRFAHLMALRSGSWPHPGDMARADIPYRTVAAAVRPVRLERVPGGSAKREQWIEEWLGELDVPVPGEAS